MAGVVHALVIGISAYPNLERGQADDRTFGLASLASAALAAYRVGKWLEMSGGFAQRPLGSLELMLVPSADELAVEPELSAYKASCDTLAFTKAIARWRDLAGENPENVSFFYFAGHGVQRPKRGDHVLLLEDFADGEGARLSKAIDSTKLIDGMAVADEQPDMARLQFYILDACRMTPEEFSRYTHPDSQAAAFWDVPPDTTNEQRAARNANVIHTAT